LPVEIKKGLAARIMYIDDPAKLGDLPVGTEKSKIKRTSLKMKICIIRLPRRSFRQGLIKLATVRSSCWPRLGLGSDRQAKTKYRHRIKEMAVVHDVLFIALITDHRRPLGTIRKF
jgi:hypothetical protein